MTLMSFNPRQTIVMTHAHAKIKVRSQLVQKYSRNKHIRTDGHDRSHYLSR